jgi:hypothetical protein
MSKPRGSLLFYGRHWLRMHAIFAQTRFLAMPMQARGCLRITILSSASTAAMTMPLVLLAVQTLQARTGSGPGVTGDRQNAPYTAHTTPSTGLKPYRYSTCEATSVQQAAIGSPSQVPPQQPGLDQSLEVPTSPRHASTAGSMDRSHAS